MIPEYSKNEVMAGFKNKCIILYSFYIIWWIIEIKHLGKAYLFLQENKVPRIEKSIRPACASQSLSWGVPSFVYKFEWVIFILSSFNYYIPILLFYEEHFYKRNSFLTIFWNFHFFNNSKIFKLFVRGVFETNFRTKVIFGFLIIYITILVGYPVKHFKHSNRHPPP